jgi:oxaloacetate decarboxylase gamma subunit
MRFRAVARFYRTGRQTLDFGAVPDIYVDATYIEEIGSMTIAQMLGQSGMMAVIGMGIVFSFLVLLIIAVSLTGKIIHALGLDKDVQAVPAGRGPSPAAVNQTAVVAAIGAAVTQYQKDNS